MVNRIGSRGWARVEAHRHAELPPELFEFRFDKPRRLASLSHTRDATPPLFHKVEFMEDASDDPIAYLGHSLPNVLYGESDREKPRTTDLDSVVEYRDANWRSLDRVISVYDRIHDCLPEGCGRERPAFGSPDSSYYDLPCEVLFHEADRVFDAGGEWTLKPAGVEDTTPITSIETPDVNPGIGKVFQTIFPE